MTIAIMLKVGDGLVLGADSASTLVADEGDVYNVYFNAEKVFNLVRGWPIGVVTYGLGGLGGRSVASLAKDLRERLTSSDDAWHLSETSYTMEDVANGVKRFFYDELYRKEFPQDDAGTEDSATAPVVQNTATAPPISDEEQGAAESDAPVAAAPKPKFEQMGFLIGGFSANARQPEVWQVEARKDGKCYGPTLLGGEEDSGMVWGKGQPEAVYRLLRGYSPRILWGMVKAGMTVEEARKFLEAAGAEPLVHPAMPIQDAIDLVQYLVDVTCGFVRFTPGAPTVAPPVDLAAITRYESFRWVKRKHYYSAGLNHPVEVHRRL